MKQDNLSLRKIAKELGVDTNTVIKYSKPTSSFEIVNQNEAVTKQTNNAKKIKPEERKKSPVNKETGQANRVNWELRDLELSIIVETECKKILADLDNKPTRVTFSRVAKRIGKLNFMQRNKGKLPITMSVLGQYVESVEHFQTRRVKWIVQELVAGNEELKRWRIEKLAGLKPGYGEQVQDEIEKQLKQFAFYAPKPWSEGEITWRQLN
ncbi:hypothetical protein EFBL_0032 [Effusibacillus lacus]|uniref:Transposon Tn7 transposition protein TnsD C-terminal domain-containing protein n=1 Tax=Effusibacillus lacus TaxID=1348429 RepID=A0A292YI98_9BACL|nr:hypothetical protein EFBL_0032 [Effusibacillus lacus]